MNKIQYNSKEEAYEIKYKLWDKEITVRFYVEDQQEIMDNFSAIAQKLDMVNRSKNKIAEMIVDEGYYEGSIESLEKCICITKAYIDIDYADENETEVVVCFTVAGTDGYMSDLAVELYGDDFEITGYSDY